jgi:hypothetical protein
VILAAFGARDVSHGDNLGCNMPWRGAFANLPKQSVIEDHALLQDDEKYNADVPVHLLSTWR